MFAPYDELLPTGIGSHPLRPECLERPAHFVEETIPWPASIVHTVP